MAMGMVMCVDEVWFLIGVLVGFMFCSLQSAIKCGHLMCNFDNAIKIKFTLVVVDMRFFG